MISDQIRAIINITAKSALEVPISLLPKIRIEVDQMIIPLVRLFVYHRRIMVWLDLLFNNELVQESILKKV